MRIYEKGVFEWHKLFKESCETVENDKRSGHPSSHRIGLNAEKVWNLLHSDRRLSIRSYYMEILKLLHKVLHRKGPELCPSNWTLHHDNAPAQ
jgi:hypothetical protein